MKRLRLVMCIPLAALLLSGCSTSKEELLPAGDQTMLELWQGKTTGGEPATCAGRQGDTVAAPDVR